ncbi:response regulator [Niabella drilacis]|uniref:Two component transcriptional regulator, LuxR family n=1 Tax=Niabella drilacis (strain DSM 25811 / CCM 8410 / CCUG 62505 / LMG 26954 / E90) TaxID=1285928 RepID=A0A1G6MUR5_NIADE|nr:response regulator transcription factor [Niabella drilacis]SDC58716.1 two component transcriptional regulator, LuxR family [Niabella drilacis]
MDKLKVIVVDDHPMVIEGMRAMLQQILYVELCAAASDAFMALEMVRKEQPDLVITDINLPEISGIELTARLKKESPAIKVIGMSTFNDRSYISQMIQSGADGFLVKSASKEEIERAISSVMDGQMYLSVDINMDTQEKKALKDQPVLTRREKEILSLIADGLTNPQIAGKLFISLNTVDTHRKNLLAKFETNNSASLIRLASKSGII